VNCPWVANRPSEAVESVKDNLNSAIVSFTTGPRDQGAAARWETRRKGCAAHFWHTPNQQPDKLLIKDELLPVDLWPAMLVDDPLVIGADAKLSFRLSD